MTAPLCFPSIVTEPVILTFAKVLRRLYEKSRKSATHEKTSVNRFLCGRKFWTLSAWPEEVMTTVLPTAGRVPREDTVLIHCNKPG